MTNHNYTGNNINVIIFLRVFELLAILIRISMVVVLKDYFMLTAKRDEIHRIKHDLFLEKFERAITYF
jgi:hypothetical protein